jgi:hypothetical protein
MSSARVKYTQARKRARLLHHAPVDVIKFNGKLRAERDYYAGESRI